MATIAETESADGLRALLRCDAQEADAEGEETPVRGELWTALSSGIYRLVDHFMTDQRCFALLRDSPWQASNPRPRTEWLERVLRADTQKGVALDLRIAPSTLATGLKQRLTELGVHARPSKMPLPVMLLARSAEQTKRGAVWRQSTFIRDGSVYQVVSWIRPDAAIAGMLSPAECSVVRLVIEGLSHSEIASRRRTSVRTIANQLASAFRRLKVSGRLQLCQYVVDLPAESDSFDTLVRPLTASRRSAADSCASGQGRRGSRARAVHRRAQCDAPSGHRTPSRMSADS